VVIADDHRLVLDGIRRALEADGDFEIVGETQSGMQVLPLVAREKPDLVLLTAGTPSFRARSCGRGRNMRQIRLAGRSIQKRRLRIGLPATSSVRRSDTEPMRIRRRSKRVEHNVVPEEAAESDVALRALAHASASTDSASAADERLENPDESGDVRLLFVPGQAYRLVELEPRALRRGATIELEDGTYVVARLGPAPLPGDSRRCAYLELAAP
jgi:CheY-like chemotaxis protein